jgi:predicted nuclease of predicted toxin-antitoxin system
MKLLLDENLTFRLTKSLQAGYPGSCHVKDVDLLETDDNLLWQWAHQRNGFAILTQDAKFEQLARLRGYPPKVIYLRFGNSSLLNTISQLRHYRDVIIEFYLDSEAACLELSQAALTDVPAE